MEQDYIVRDLVIEQEAVINVNELYNRMKKWFLQRGYFYIEKEHHNKNIDNKHQFKIKMESGLKVDDYNRFFIKVTISGKNLDKTKLKNKDAVKGKISVAFESWITRDYEERWENRPVAKFFRTIYDKFVLGDKSERYSKELKDQTYLLYDEVKTFLGLEKFH